MQWVMASDEFLRFFFEVEWGEEQTSSSETAPRGWTQEEGCLPCGLISLLLHGRVHPEMPSQGAGQAQTEGRTFYFLPFLPSFLLFFLFPLFSIFFNRSKWVKNMDQINLLLQIYTTRSISKACLGPL